MYVRASRFSWEFIICTTLCPYSIKYCIPLNWHILRAFAMVDAFNEAQKRWCETLVSDPDLCDAVAFLGPEGHRVPFIRAHLASLSKPFRAALYGEFREGCQHEIVLKDVNAEAFDVILRSACNLDPKLTPQRALHALQAAKVYMIDDLEKYCQHYLENLNGLDCTLILQTMTTAAQLSLELPVEVQKTYWANLLVKSTHAVGSPAFVEAHGSIIAKLIKMDEFEVNEETFWNRLVEWSANAVLKPSLLGPYADSTPCTDPKRAKKDTEDSNDVGANTHAQQGAILKQMSPYIRYGKMQKSFFVDRVRKYLDREKSDTITDYLMLGREPQGMLTEARGGLKDVSQSARNEERLIFSTLVNDTPFNLPWTPTNPLKLKFRELVEVDKLEFKYRYNGPFGGLSLNLGHKGLHVQADSIYSGTPTEPELTLQVSSIQCETLVVWGDYRFHSQHVFGITVFGKKISGRLKLANQVVERLSTDLLTTSETPASESLWTKSEECPCPQAWKVSGKALCEVHVWVRQLKHCRNVRKWRGKMKGMMAACASKRNCPNWFGQLDFQLWGFTVHHLTFSKLLDGGETDTYCLIGTSMS